MPAVAAETTWRALQFWGATMGASGWNYFVPYQPDTGRALKSLREEIFRSGAYGRGFLSGEDIAPPEADTIEELLERVGAEGTHSILDIECMADEPDIGWASPAPERLLRRAVRVGRADDVDIPGKAGGLSNKLFC